MPCLSLGLWRWRREWQGSEGDDGTGEVLTDVVLIGRQFLREPEWVLHAAGALGVKLQWPV